ncbi:hypothetical protein CL1_1101 [Thermococcus cleftensis]|uniref:Uncharacterized protein n=1 Tax=Thermococcus cleftensis (strain DSM 27260 / KACC 17922 / CL1) TaxID=163003 RepID=I3ZUC0_THECF|nr:hypothetical protein [Thermococcus cleftensis]AFL95304.1 hypothetical protein CL1_1101 [Thermococcus cleftensis]
MRRYAFLLIVLLVIATAGCLGGNGQAPTTTEGQISTPTTTPNLETTTSSSPTETTTTTFTPPELDLNGLLENVLGIKQFTYLSNATLNMTVTIEGNGTSQNDNVSLRIIERGYIDFDSWSAWINSTTLSLQDGARTNASRIVVNNVTYIQTPVGWVTSEDPTVSEVLWRYSVVGLAREYLGEKPDSVEGGEVIRLTYLVPDYKLKPLAALYFAVSENTDVVVRDGKLELWFRDGRLVGGRLSFSVSSTAEVDDPVLGKMTITQAGTWDETFKVTSINEKRKVNPPT